MTFITLMPSSSTRTECGNRKKATKTNARRQSRTDRRTYCLLQMTEHMTNSGSQISRSNQVRLTAKPGMTGEGQEVQRARSKNEWRGRSLCGLHAGRGSCREERCGQEHLLTSQDASLLQFLPIQFLHLALRMFLASRVLPQTVKGTDTFLE